MLEAVVRMRDLIANPLWWAHVAACNCDEDGNLDIENVLAIAAYSVTGFEEAVQVAEAVADVTLDNRFVAYDDVQDLLLGILNNVIDKESKVN